MNLEEKNKAFAEGGVVTGSDFDPFGVHKAEKGEVIVPNQSARTTALWEGIMEKKRELNRIIDALQSSEPNQ